MGEVRSPTENLLYERLVALDNEWEVREGVRDGDLRPRAVGWSRPSGERCEGATPHLSTKSRREILTDFLWSPRLLQHTTTANADELRK